MTKDIAEYKHIVGLGGLLVENKSATKADSPLSELTDEEHRAELRKRQSRSYARIREKVASLLLAYEKNPRELGNDEYMRRVDDCRQSLVKTRSDVHNLSSSDTVMVKDIIANSQIMDLIRRIDRFKKTISFVDASPAEKGDSEAPASSSEDAIDEDQKSDLENVIYETKYIYADILISFAQADNRIDRRERKLLDDIFAHMGLDSNILRKMWLTPRTIEVITAILENITDRIFKCCLLKDCYLVAYADETFVPEERVFIDRIKMAAKLGRELEVAIHKWAERAIKVNSDANILFGRLITESGIQPK